MGKTVFTECRGGVTTLKYDEDDRRLVCSHIDSFPRDVSHYTRAQTGDREYLSQDLTIRKMYKAFKIAYPNSHVTLRYYWSVWKTDFPNLSFWPPRMDTCKDCDRLHASSQQRNEQGRRAKEELNQHHIEVERTLQCVQADFTGSTLPNSTAMTITMDLQKVFHFPKLFHSSMYYARQLSCYNFGVHIADFNTAVMSVWHEGIAGRGANEILVQLLHRNGI